MNEQAKDAIAADVAEMMTRYSFDLGGYTLNQWLEQWLRQYPAAWLPGSVVEALYQGRYKAISVWQILDLWRRRGKPLQHFNREFERIVSGRSLQLLFSPSTAPAKPDSNLLLVSAANQQQIWTQNGNFTEAAEPVVTTLTAVKKSPLILSAASAPEASGLAEITSPHPAIEPFKPPEQFKLSLPNEIQRTRTEAARYPIQQFVPTLDASDFHGKLKAIAQTLSIVNAQVTTNHLATVGQTTPQEPVPPPNNLEQHQPGAGDPADETSQDPQSADYQQ